MVCRKIETIVVCSVFQQRYTADDGQKKSENRKTANIHPAFVMICIRLARHPRGEEAEHSPDSSDTWLVKQLVCSPLPRTGLLLPPRQQHQVAPFARFSGISQDPFATNCHDYPRVSKDDDSLTSNKMYHFHRG